MQRPYFTKRVCYLAIARRPMPSFFLSHLCRESSRVVTTKFQLSVISDLLFTLILGVMAFADDWDIQNAYGINYRALDATSDWNRYLQLRVLCGVNGVLFWRENIYCLSLSSGRDIQHFIKLSRSASKRRAHTYSHFMSMHHTMYRIPQQVIIQTIYRPGHLSRSLCARCISK
jgi:hypothetical protein